MPPEQPQQPQSDPVSMFKALPQDKQKEYWGKLSPEQRTKFYNMAKGKVSGGAGGSYTPFTTGQKVARVAADVLPTATAGIGAGVGSLAGPLGAIGGAAIGGALGKEAAMGIQGAAKLPEAPKTTGEALKGVAIEGAAQGALQGLGEGAGALLGKVGARGAKRIIPLVNKYIGLKISDLPVWDRLGVKGADEVAGVMIQKGLVKNTLEATHAAIEGERASVNAQTESLIHNTPNTRYADIHSLMLDAAVKIDKELGLAGRTAEAHTAIDKNLDAMMESLQREYHITGSQATTEQLFALRKGFQKEINWKDTDPTNVRQKFLQELYPKINQAIKDSLPARESRQFAELNRQQSRLIVARDAAGGKLAEGETTARPGAATLLKRAAVGATVGGLGGAAISKSTGHKEYTAEGAILGALWASGGRHGSFISHGMEAPVGDIKTAQRLAKYAPQLAKAAKVSPQAARALQMVRKTQKDLSDREPGR